MKVMLKRAISILFVALIVLPCISSITYAEGSFNVSGTVMTNEYLSLSVSSTNGRFTIGTTEGNPDSDTDNNKKMLFGWPSTGTSYTTVVVDGNIKIFGDNGFTQQPTFIVADGTNTSIATYGDISVKQILTIVNNNSTNREDVVEIKYEVTNNGTAYHTYGTRVMLDTMLGGNDSAPFRIPDIGAVTTQTEFTGDNIPQYWQAFDSLTDPEVVAQGSFLRSNTNKPDTVQFTNWGKVQGTPWNCPISAGSSNGDSAVTVIWNSKGIAPGETKVYTTHYGLSELVQDLKPPLAVSLYGDSTVYIENSTYSPNPLKLTAYIQNIGNGNANNVKVYLVVGDGSALSVDNSSVNIITVGTLTPNQEYQCSWNINVNRVSEETIQMIGIKVVADGLEDKTLFKYITVPAVGKDNCILWGSQNRNGSWSGQDNLSFINTKSSFLKHSGLFGLGSGWKDDYYHISDEYFNMLTNGMSNTVWSYVDKGRNSNWVGSCYGMSCVVSLMKDGRLTPNNYKSKAVNTHDLNSPVDNDNVENLVNFYQLMCRLPDWQEISKTFGKMNVESAVLRDLVNEVQKVKNGGLPVVICYSWQTNELDESGEHKGGAHAIVGYEVATVSEEINGETFRYRISICDPNKNAFSYLYINADFTNWQYPSGLNTTGDGASDSVWVENGEEQKCLYTALSSINYIDLINPETGMNRTRLKNYNSNFISSYTSPNFAVIDGSGKVCKMNTVYSFDGSTVYNYLPDEQNYKIVPSSSNKNIDCSVVLNHSSLDLNATNVNSVTVDSNGAVLFEGNKSQCGLTLTLNDENQSLNCFRFNIFGTNIDDYSARSVNDGLLIGGSDLTDTSIIANNRKLAVQVDVSTNDTSVMLKDIDENTIGVYVDNDSNGTYETLIAESTEYIQNNNKTTFWDLIINFFANIINWFKAIFGI